MPTPLVTLVTVIVGTWTLPIWWIVVCTVLVTMTALVVSGRVGRHQPPRPPRP
jgi:hypothetical protein